MLASQRLGARPYSLSALQKFATCPYQFLLSAIYRLEPNDEPEPLQRLDPLTRGALFHAVQAEFFRTLQARGPLPLDAKALPAALQLVDRKLTEVAAAYRERLAPAIDRVWRDEIAALGRDLRVWVRRLPQAGGWKPGVLRVQLRPVGRGTRPAERPRSGDDRRPVPAAGIRGPRGAAAGWRTGARDRSQDREESLDAADGHRRRRHAAAGALRHGHRTDPRPSRSCRGAFSTAPRRAASPSTRSRSTRPTAAQVSTRSRSSIARSSWAFCRRRPLRARARGAISERSAVRTKRNTLRASRRPPGRSDRAAGDAMTPSPIRPCPTPRRARPSPASRRNAHRRSGGRHGQNDRARRPDRHDPGGGPRGRRRDCRRDVHRKSRR